MNRILEAIKQLLEATVANPSSPLYYDANDYKNGIRAVYFGDPLQIPMSSHPALVVHPIGTTYEKRGSRYDQKVHSVEIRLVDNAANYLATTPADGLKVPSVERFGDMIEKSASDQETSSVSICGLIQNNPNLPYVNAESKEQETAAIDSRVRSVQYVFNSARGYPTFEAIILVEVIAQGDR